MGKRGPKKRPTKEEIRLGNPGKRAINGQEPEPTGLPEPPDYLDTYARGVWDRVMLAMSAGVYTACDTELLAAYCTACSRLRFAHAMYSKTVKGVSSGGDTAEMDKWDRRAQRNSAVVASTGTRLGLDPSARTAIKIQDKKPQGKFGEYIVMPGGKK